MHIAAAWLSSLSHAGGAAAMCYLAAALAAAVFLVLARCLTDSLPQRSALAVVRNTFTAAASAVAVLLVIRAAGVLAGAPVTVIESLCAALAAVTSTVAAASLYRARPFVRRLLRLMET